LPKDTGVTNPVDGFMVATAVFAEDQIPPDTVEIKVVFAFKHIADVPLNVPALEAAVTVMVLVAVALAQPPAPKTVYVITAVPAETAETNPLVTLIVAILVLLDDHVPPKTVEDNVVVPFEQIDVDPLNIPALEGAVTVIVIVAVALAHPPVPDIV
jgi:hypothetical protein